MFNSQRYSLALYHILNRQTDLLLNKDLGFSLVSDAEIRKSILQRTSIKNNQHTVSSIA